MKKSLILMLGMMAALSASADKYITFQQQDGTERSLPLTNLLITFKDGQLVANTNAESYQVELRAMKMMWFADEPTAIEELNAGDVYNEKEDAIYDIEGRRLSTADSMTRGIYIIKSNNKTRKVLVK